MGTRQGLGWQRALGGQAGQGRAVLGARAGLCQARQQGRGDRQAAATVRAHAVPKVCVHGSALGIPESPRPARPVRPPGLRFPCRRQMLSQPCPSSSSFCGAASSPRSSRPEVPAQPGPPRPRCAGLAEGGSGQPRSPPGGLGGGSALPAAPQPWQDVAPLSDPAGALLHPPLPRQHHRALVVSIGHPGGGGERTGRGISEGVAASGTEPSGHRFGGDRSGAKPAYGVCAAWFGVPKTGVGGQHCGGFGDEASTPQPLPAPRAPSAFGAGRGLQTPPISQL